MIRKKVTLFGNALREISEGSTSSATFTTAVPLTIKTRTPNMREVEAAGIRLLLGVTSRTTNDATPLSLNVFLEEQDPVGVWRGLDGSTMTPVVTATTFEKLEIFPYFGGVTAVAPFATTRRSLLLPSTIRAVAKLQGSITVTPGMTFYLQADLYSE
jgi:hypothetical protein